MPFALALPLIVFFVVASVGCGTNPSTTSGARRDDDTSTSSKDSRSSLLSSTLPSSTCGVATIEEHFVDVAASDPGIHYVGRFDFTDPHAPKMAFPAVTIETLFEGDAIDMRLHDMAAGGPQKTLYFDVFIDDRPPVKLATCSAQEVYPLARGLESGQHLIRISKRTEAEVGTAAFLGFRVRRDTALATPPPRARRIEFIGDSITCGYGNEVATTDPSTHPFTSANENALRSFAGLTAQALDAEFVMVAASGKGIMRNFEDRVGPTVPEFYALSAPDLASPRADLGRFSPDVIVVNLGSNDFSVGLSVSELPSLRERFKARYISFLTELRALYPLATFITVNGPMLSDQWPPGYRAFTLVTSVVQEVVTARREAGDANIHDITFATQTSPYGEDWHPTVATHQRMADALVPFIRERVGW